ncbi:MAG: glycosyltransferase, partial [Myxococcota bacterium]
MNPTSISAFFPACNDWGTIASQILLTARTLAGLTDEWEIIVVNDASPGHCAAVLEELVERVPTLRLVTHAKRGAEEGYPRQPGHSIGVPMADEEDRVAEAVLCGSIQEHEERGSERERRVRTESVREARHGREGEGRDRAGERD